MIVRMNVFHLLCLLMLVISCEASLEVVNRDLELIKVFNPHDRNAGYQRRYTVDIKHKAEDCFFLPDLERGQILNFHFMVVNVGRNGHKLEITSRIRDPNNDIADFQNRKTEGKRIGYKIEAEGDHQICFDNRFSIRESKRVFWQFEVEGRADEALDEIKLVNATVKEFSAQSNVIKKAMGKVQSRVRLMKHNQWRIESLMKADLSRAVSIQNMIDTWSILHSILFVCISVTQVLVLRSFFSDSSRPQYIRVRT